MILGVIPEEPDVRRMKAALWMLGPCPSCGGHGTVTIYTSYGTPGWQEACIICMEPDALFWVDGLEYYTERDRIASDWVNEMRKTNGEPVTYGYFKQSQTRREADKGLLQGRLG